MERQIMKISDKKKLDSYMNLVKQMPLVIIKNERQYKKTVAFHRELAVRDEESLDEGERNYFIALTYLIEDYEEKHYRKQMGL